MTIRAGNGTCVVLKNKFHFKATEENQSPEAPMLLLGRIELEYEDGKRFSFYIEDYSLIDFIRNSLNQAKFKTIEGNRTPEL